MKTLIITLYFLLLLLVTYKAQAQIDYEISERSPHHNSVFLEYMGNSGNTISLNYERFFTKNNKWSFRFGFGYRSLNFKYYSIPTEIDYLVGKNSNFLELGFGLSHLRMYKQSEYIRSTIALFSRIGYRYSGKKGLLIRVSFNPVYDPTWNFFTDGLNFHGGISVGYSF